MSDEDLEDKDEDTPPPQLRAQKSTESILLDDDHNHANLSLDDADNDPPNASSGGGSNRNYGNRRPGGNSGGSGGGMDDRDDDIDIDNEQPKPTQQSQDSRAPKSGWGGAAEPLEPDDEQPGQDAVNNNGNNMMNGGPGVQHGRRKGSQNAPNEIKSRYDKDEGISNLDDIQDLEAEEKEDLSNKVAEAPNVMSNRLQGFSELDSQYGNALPNISADGIDLSLLRSIIVPQEKVGEQDIQWEFEGVFSDLSSEMQAEMDPPEDEREEGAEEEEEAKETIDKNDKPQADTKSEIQAN